MVTMAKISSIIHGLKPALIMVMVQTTFGGVNIFYKLAANDGMNLSILVAYRFIFSAAVMVPMALFAERNKRPKLTWMILLQSFCCGLFGGALAQNLYLKAIMLTSATFAAATSNLIPACTFVMAVIFRMETLGWMTRSGTAKITGTVLGVGGAMLLTFYKGIELHPWKTNVNLLSHGHHHAAAAQHSSKDTIVGSMLALASCFSYAIWLIVQANLIRSYPCPYSITALSSIFSAIQAIVFSLCTERHWEDWKLGWNIRLLTVAYAGLLASGVMFTFVAWVVQMRGPLFTSVFNPLMLIVVAILGSLLLNETLHLGNVLGAILIIIGLYIVLWGKGKELKKVVQLAPETESIDGDIDCESKHSSLGVIGDSESKHSSFRSGHNESRHSSFRSGHSGSRRIELVVNSIPIV